MFIDTTASQGIINPANQNITSALPLTFNQYVPPANAIGHALNWDFSATFSTGVRVAGTSNIFTFAATAGATYDIFSQSLFDPFDLQLLDDQGVIIATDDGSGTIGTDHIRFTAPSEGSYFIDASWRQGFGDTSLYAAIAVYEDLDTIPPVFPGSAPVISTFSPTNSATGVPLSSNIVFTFNEAIQGGSGMITLSNGNNALIEAFDITTSKRIAISGAALTIDPTFDLSASTPYFVRFDPGVVQDLTGHGSDAITSYGFTTTFMPNTAADRVFSWGESRYPELFPNHPQSQDILGYHARIYASGSALGEQQGNIYFYAGPGNEIVLVGSTDSFLSQAMTAGF